MRIARFAAGVLPVLLAAAPATVEIRGRVTNPLSEAEYRAVEIVVTDRVGVVLGRARPDRKGQYELKITGPQYIILKALLKGRPDAIYQLDTHEVKESTADREENRVFAELRVPTYHQNVTFAEEGRAAGLEDVLAGESAAAVKAYRQARARRDPAAFEKLIRDHPDFYIGYIDLGMLLAARQENDRAVEVFTRAQKLRPQHPWAYVGLGLALNNKQDYRAAAPYLEKAVELDPNSVAAQFQLGQAAFKLGDPDRALQCLERAVSLDPKSNPIAYKTLAAIYVNRQDPKNAARNLESYLTHFPDAADADKVRQILAKLGQ